MRLSVFRDNIKVGSLDIQASEPFFGFMYDRDYLSSSIACPLSISLPLAESRYSGKHARAYFEGLLPEGEARNNITRRLGIPRSSSVKLLGALGRDCAGDISIIDENDPNIAQLKRIDNKPEYKYSPLENGIQSIAERPYEEIPRLQEETRLSLAGGQEKIALYHNESDHITVGWYIPMLGSPSTHIIKPGILEAHYPNITLNEFLCLRAASYCGIRTVDVNILFPETPLLAVRRYDRIFSDTTTSGLSIVNRIHQEDCCQACGIASDMKYEHEGGPGFGKIRDVLAAYSMKPIDDINLLVKWGIFNFLIGNCDAHAKNISLLHNTNGTVSLAPVYDLISTAIYADRYGSRLSRSLGMKIGGHENIDKINSEDFSKFAVDVHMRSRQVKNIGEELIEQLPAALNIAAYAAEREGFSASEEMVDHISGGYEQRAKVFTGSC